jgi:hypothetical protein
MVFPTPVFMVMKVFMKVVIALDDDLDLSSSGDRRSIDSSESEEESSKSGCNNRCTHVDLFESDQRLQKMFLRSVKTKEQRD